MIEIKKSHQGRLHRALGVPEGRKLALRDLLRAKESDSPTLRKMATFAINARRWKKG